VVSVHSLPELTLDELVPALRELQRVLRPGGVLRLVLPDLGRAIDAYIAGNKNYFQLVAKDSRTAGGRFITQMLWYGYSRSLFTTDYCAELLQRAGYEDIALCEPGETASSFSGIVELDNRSGESFYIEASKPKTGRSGRGYSLRPSTMAIFDVLTVSLKGGSDDSGGLSAAHLDGPVSGMRVEGSPLRVVGWAVGRSSPVASVEVVSDQKIVGKSAVDIPRPGVAEKFAGVPGASAAGFDLKLEPSGKGVSELLINAVLDDGSRSPIATIRVDVTRQGVLSRLFG
jgi:hypothetical protein